jgi:hypothetical protein
VLEEIEVDDVGAAIAWGRVRSETVLVRLGGRGDTFFSAGAARAESDDGPLPEWPPKAPPPAGWWEPPPCPTLDEVGGISTQVKAGTMSVEEAAAWASDRLRVAMEQHASEELVEALAALAPTTVAYIEVEPEER